MRLIYAELTALKVAVNPSPYKAINLYKPQAVKICGLNFAQNAHG